MSSALWFLVVLPDLVGVSEPELPRVSVSEIPLPGPPLILLKLPPSLAAAEAKSSPRPKASPCGVSSSVVEWEVDLTPQPIPEPTSGSLPTLPLSSFRSHVGSLSLWAV